MTDIKRIEIKEFREHGYLHEVNRLVLHPLGLAMEISVFKEPTVRLDLREDDVKLFEELADALGDALHDKLTQEQRDSLAALMVRLDQSPVFEVGDEILGGVWDDREDPEGTSYGEDLLSADKAVRVCTELLAKREKRMEILGYITQPVPTSERTLTINYLDPDKPKMTDAVEFEQ